MTAHAASLKSLTNASGDADLVVRALSGREDGFEELVRRYQRPIVAYVYRMVGDYDTALDLAARPEHRAIRAGVLGLLLGEVDGGTSAGDECGIQRGAGDARRSPAGVGAAPADPGGDQQPKKHRCAATEPAAISREGREVVRAVVVQAMGTRFCRRGTGRNWCG